MDARGIRAVWAVALLGAAGATLGEEPAREGSNVFTLGEVSVTGTPDPRAAATEESVSQEEMRRFDSSTLFEAANLVPGVTLSRVGARNEYMLFLRGLDIKHVPIYLDGIPIYVPYDGYPDLGRFFTYDLSELVISKGLTSVLYGPNTMGGAINMVSRRPAQPVEGDVGARVATGTTYDLWGNAGSGHELWYGQAGVSLEHSDGFRLPADFTARPSEDGGERNNSYHRDWKASAKVGWTPVPGDEYALSFSYQHGVKGTPPYAGYDLKDNQVRYWRWPFWDKESLYFTSHTQLGEASYLKVRLYHDIFNNSLWSYDDATYTTITRKYAFRSYYYDYTDGGSIEVGTTLLPRNDLKAAFHVKDDVHREHNLPLPLAHFEDRIYSLGLEDTVHLLSSLSAVAGVSYDALDTVEAKDTNKFDPTTGTYAGAEKGNTDAWNPQLGLYWTAPTGGVAHAGVARKSRLPSIKDRYSYRLGTAEPNPDLKAERATNYEVGYEDKLAGVVKAAATGFYHDITDFILLTNVGGGLTQNQNVGKVHQQGVELEASAPLGTLAELGANYTYVHSQNLSSSLKLTGIPDHKVMGYARLTPFGGLSLLASAEYDSRRYSSTDGLDRAGGYLLVNAKLGWEPLARLNLEVGVENLFDRLYAIDDGYPEAGRTFFAEARYEF